MVSEDKKRRRRGEIIKGAKSVKNAHKSLNFHRKHPEIIQNHPYFKSEIFDISAIPAPKERHYYRKAQSKNNGHAALKGRHK